MQKRLSRELQGWNQEILSRKLSQLAKIIQKMNQGKGADILGVCEVENKNVLLKLLDMLDLPERNYQVAHADTSDQRGIDIAVIYDANHFEAKENFSRVILKRNATRDLFQVNLKEISTNRDLVIIGNHWPSRRGGKYESEPYRIMAAETLAYWHERILDIMGEDTAIVAMGDFNDEPFDRSVKDYALSNYQQAKVINSRNAKFYNLMWPLFASRLGTHYYNNEANILDQIMVSKGLLSGDSGFVLLQDQANIEIFEEMNSGGDYPDPIRFGRPSSKFNHDGYSDHYPVSFEIKTI